MQEPYECLCLQCGLTHSLSPVDLILEELPDADYPVATNCFCEQCNGILAVLDAEGEAPPEEER